ncbi:MAG: NUDIX hydrolase [Patescibacteria group bacterium]
MELKAWETVPGSREVMHENPYYSVYREKFILPSGKEGMYHVVQGDPAAMIVPLLPNGKIRMVKQYRYISQEESLEFPCGSTRHGNRVDSPEEAAIRELAEEAHLGGILKSIGNFSPWNGISSERCFVFVAEECSESIMEADETEEFLFFDFTPKEIANLIREGKITDGMSLAAWVLFQTYANL